MVQSIYNERAGALLEQLRANQERNELIKNDLSSSNLSSFHSSVGSSGLLPIAMADGSEQSPRGAMHRFRSEVAESVERRTANPR